MQITIDTSRILGDETTIRSEVVEMVSAAIVADMRKQAREALAERLNTDLARVMGEVLGELIPAALDHQFTETDSYGRVGKTASIRSRIADYVQTQCTFKEQYGSKNMFATAVHETVSAEVQKFRKEFDTLVTRKMLQDTLDAAVKRLKETLGIKP